MADPEVPDPLAAELERVLAAIEADPDPERALKAASRLAAWLPKAGGRVAAVRLRQVNRLRATWEADPTAGGFTRYLAEVMGVHPSRAGQLDQAARALAEREGG
jgi:hypothetical protein